MRKSWYGTIGRDVLYRLFYVIERKLIIKEMTILFTEALHFTCKSTLRASKHIGNFSMEIPAG